LFSTLILLSCRLHDISLGDVLKSVQSKNVKSNKVGFSVFGFCIDVIIRYTLYDKQVFIL